MGRKELKGMAADVATSFISRNNDWDGYWTIGKLHSYARERSTTKILIHVSGQMRGTLSEFASIAARYGSRIEAQAAAKGLGIRASQIEVEFDLPKTSHCSADETGFSCTVTIFDDRGRAWTCKASGCSHPHDPKRELRSSRAQGQA